MKMILTMAAAIVLAFNANGKTANDAVALLKGFEGFRPTVYKCVAGKDTIGYGFTSKDMVKRGRMTEKEASAELQRLCNAIAARLRAELGEGNQLTANEEAAVVSFIYNVGWANFKNSTMCRLLKEGKRGAVIGAEFRKWVYVTTNGKKVVSKGLKNRRTKEASVFARG